MCNTELPVRKWLGLVGQGEVTEDVIEQSEYH